MSWDGNGSSSASQRLQNWLDPQNSGVTSLDGYDPNQPTLAYDASVTAVSEPSGTYCSNYINPSITIKNNGSNTLTSASIVYDVDGGSSSTYNWTGSLTTGSSATVSLSSMSVSSSGAHTFNVSISSPNGQTDGNQNNNQGSSSFECYPGTAETLLNLTFDCWGSEVSWEIVDQTTSNVLFSAPAGTYSDNAPTGYAVTETLCLSDGCYDFNINDGYGDGMAGAQYNSCDVDGNYTITDPWGSQTYVQMADPDYGNGTSHTFCINNTLVEELDKLNIAVYPNPANNFINLRLLDKSFFDNVNLELFDISGRKLVDYQNIFTADLFTLDVSSFSQGVYSLTLSNGQFTVVERILIK